MEEDPISLPDSPDYIKVMNKHELAGAVSLDDNPELEAIFFEGQEHRITSALDAINSAFGDGAIKLAVQGSGRIHSGTFKCVK